MPGWFVGHCFASRKKLTCTCFLVNGILQKAEIAAFVQDLEAKDVALTGVFATLGPWLALIADSTWPGKPRHASIAKNNYLFK
jgi:hypothetical protein